MLACGVVQGTTKLSHALASSDNAALFPQPLYRIMFPIKSPLCLAWWLLVQISTTGRHWRDTWLAQFIQTFSTPVNFHLFCISNSIGVTKKSEADAVLQKFFQWVEAREHTGNPKGHAQGPGKVSSSTWGSFMWIAAQCLHNWAFSLPLYQPWECPGSHGGPTEVGGSSRHDAHSQDRSPVPNPLCYTLTFLRHDWLAQEHRLVIIPVVSANVSVVTHVCKHGFTLYLCVGKNNRSLHTGWFPSVVWVVIVP